MKIREIANWTEIVEQIAKLLMQFEKELNSFQTDVYMYIDEETGTATLNTFINVGGNSWLDDDHKTIYRDMEHNETMYDYYCNRGDFADALEMDYEDLKKEVIEFLKNADEIEESEDYEPDWYETQNYIKTRQDYVDTLQTAYEKHIEKCYNDFFVIAKNIIWRAEEEEEEEENMKNW